MFIRFNNLINIFVDGSSNVIYTDFNTDLKGFYLKVPLIGVPGKISQINIDTFGVIKFDENIELFDS